MRSTLWGYVTAVIEEATIEGQLDQIYSEVKVFEDAVLSSNALASALADPDFMPSTRAAIVSDLVASKGHPLTTMVLRQIVIAEHIAKVVETINEVLHRLEQSRGISDVLDLVETNDSRQIAKMRLYGYALALFHRALSTEVLDEVEDELFRFARAVENSPELRRTLADIVLPVNIRLGIIRDLLASKVSPTTLRVISYVLRAGRMRDMVGALDEMVSLVAFERGRRVAQVRSAVVPSASQVAEISAKLTASEGVPVEVRVVVDPALLGGMVITVGTTMIDGTVKHKLDELAEDLGVSRVHS